MLLSITKLAPSGSPIPGVTSLSVKPLALPSSVILPSADAASSVAVVLAALSVVVEASVVAAVVLAALAKTVFAFAVESVLAEADD